MKQVTQAEAKKILLSVVQEIHKICEENQFRYTLIYGTLLGAVRHQGFIPWDDDLDIAMPRPDYQRFVEYCRTHDTPFSLKCIETDSRYGYLFAKACDKNTVLIEKHANRHGVDFGLYVDIFPIDGLGDTTKDAQKKLASMRLGRELLVAAQWRHYFKSTTHPWYYEPIRFCIFLISRFVSHEKLIRKITQQYEAVDVDRAKYVGIMCGAYRNREIMERDVYLEFCDTQFEGVRLRSLQNSDRYLTTIYRNYRQLPPEEKRVARHTFSVYYKENCENE